MVKNYFKVIIQNLLRNKFYSLLNILGLSLGLAVCLIILQYVRFEKSYDRFHINGDHKYRVVMEMIRSDGGVELDAANFGPAAVAMKTDFPEVIDYVRITPEYSRVVFNYRDLAFEEQKVYYVDSTFFTFFSYKLLVGDPVTALQEPNSVVLSKSSAEKYFGPSENWKQSPLNQIITLNNKIPLKITGIMENLPPNSHFSSQALISFSTFLSTNTLHWGWNDFYTYIELAPGTDYKALEAKLPAFIDKYKGKDQVELNNRMVLQPLHDIHLYSNVGFELNPNGSAQVVYFLSIISILILIIAWVNYINLSTARAENRAKEIGIRKVNGASRGEVMIQFLLESFFMNFISLILAFILVNLTLPYVGQLLDKPLKFSIFQDEWLPFYVLSILLAGSILSGLYPAIILSGYKPVSIFKASSSHLSRGSFSLRQSLVIIQLIMSCGLITGTIIIENQMQYIRNKELGFDYDKTIVFNAPSTMANDSLFLISYQRFKHELLNYPQIEGVTVSSALPGKSHNDLDMAGGLRMAGDDEKVNHTLTSFRIDEDFLETFKMGLIAGKNFTNYDINKDAVILNRKGAELLGYKDPDEIIGKKIHYWGKDKEIVGVIENYHHKSLKNNFEPTIMRADIGGMLYITARLSASNDQVQETIKNINNLWSTLYPADPFKYYFLDSHVNEQYKADLQFSRIFTIFSGFSIFIACLGLFGLVSYSVTVRIKEIGVRKVLGASVLNIVILFSKDYLKLLIIAFVVGIPLANYILTLWINNFAYKATMSWWYFLLPAIVVAFLALLAVCTQIVKAALVNPAISLRSE